MPEDLRDLLACLLTRLHQEQTMNTLERQTLHQLELLSEVKYGEHKREVCFDYIGV
jgi:hypothetical protein